MGFMKKFVFSSVALLFLLSGCATADHTATFFKIADASCEKALLDGVVEQSIDEAGFTLVMVPKDQAIKEFSAAYYETANKFELIYEVDAFGACYASIANSLAEEGGVESQIKVSFANGAYETFEDLGEFGMSRILYDVKDGLFVATQKLESPDADKRKIKYGQLTDSELSILQTAVDRYLANQ